MPRSSWRANRRTGRAGEVAPGWQDANQGLAFGPWDGPNERGAAWPWLENLPCKRESVADREQNHLDALILVYGEVEGSDGFR